MEPHMASLAGDAIVWSGHPRVDYRTDEGRAVTDWMEPHLGPLILPGSSLLDIGCSSGKATFRAEELGANATGIDCSSEAIRLAREIAGDIGSSAVFVEGDYSAIPFGPSSFDIALFPKNIIECSYAEVERIGEQLEALLRPGGVLVVTMRDGLETLTRDSRGQPTDFGHESGSFRDSITVPCSGTFEYPVYFWTVAFAIHVIGRCLSFESCRSIDENHYLLLFRKPADEGAGE